MISKHELLEQLHEQGIMLDIMQQRNDDLQKALDRKTHLLDAIIFKDKIKFGNFKDFNAYEEFMNDVFNNPIKPANC